VHGQADITVCCDVMTAKLWDEDLTRTFPRVAWIITELEKLVPNWKTAHAEFLEQVEWARASLKW
jgi:hypothetical protein